MRSDLPGYKGNPVAELHLSAICKGLGSLAHLLTPLLLTLQTESTIPSCVCRTLTLICWLLSPSFPIWLLPSLPFSAGSFLTLLNSQTLSQVLSWQSSLSPSS